MGESRTGPSSPWPSLPDEAGGVRASGTGRADAARPDGTSAGGRAAHRDRWPALPDEPVPWPSTAPRAAWRESRLDREQAGG
ncbi:hypothetical protein [Micromonospora sp. NPDC049282]|uniref:hypothetical protein n=1 Tax=Micromonospora sp. NPDC049282 TaxID=3364269 RepID=UPI00371617E2